MRRTTAVIVILVALVAATACQPRLGSRDNTFGNNLVGDLDGDGVVDPGECIDPAAGCAGSQPFLWGAINSPFYDNANGDPFSSRCLTGTSCPDGPSNPEYRPGGYTYGIEVAEAGQTVTVQVYDAPAYYGVSNNHTGDSGSFRTGYGLFREDGSALTATTTPDLSMAGACASGPGARVFPGQHQPSTYHNRWWTLCTFTADAAGTYPLVVRTNDLPADPSTGSGACTEPTPCTESSVNGGVRRGLNSFAIRATAAGGPQPRVAAVGDLSIYTPTSSTTSEIDLVEVAPHRAGQTMVVDLYDPGDGSSGAIIVSLLDPWGSALPCTVGIGGSDGVRTDPPAMTESYPGGCAFPTRTTGGTNRFNDRWGRVTVEIPPGYSCPADDCWWTLRTQTTGALAVDRITIAVSFENPT